MQILTTQTKQGASISGRRKASEQKAVIGKSGQLFLLGRKSGSGLTSAGLVNGMYPLKQRSWRTKHSGGVILHHWERGRSLAKAFPMGRLQSGQSAAAPPEKSSLSVFLSLMFHLHNQECFSNHPKRGQNTTQVDFSLELHVLRSSGQRDTQQR